MEWGDWFMWCIIFCSRYSQLFWIYLKKHREKTDNPSIRKYVNKIENRITFKIKTAYYLELLTPNLLASYLGAIKLVKMAKMCLIKKLLK